MTSSTVSKREAQVPDLIQTPALTITAEDVALPRLYVGQFMTKAVQEQLVKPGTIFSAAGAEDADPVVLFDPAKKDPGVLFHVLGLRKGKSWTAGPGEELQLFDYDDPAAPADAWITYNYTVYVPEGSDDVPYKLLLTRTGKPAALQINTVLKKNSISGPSWETAFRLTTSPRENNKGKYFVPRVAVVEATKEHIATAQTIALDMFSQATAPTARSEEPAI